MAVRGVRPPPYEVGLSIVNWVREPGRWHELDGDYTGRNVNLRKLPFERFLNVIYFEMLRRLENDPKNPSRPRRQLDQQLKVSSWRTPGGAYRQRQRVPDAPAWWRGDEDASQTFLHAMGVVSLQ